ncbi:hypothetical protein SH668x_002010 [Planctomicrobium sp. SH668]|uniref:hypothetical protein n=1 Tax=Planctomicrobium sp. SH668 TaxID=3448126 RepID=UPI003F5C9EBC
MKADARLPDILTEQLQRLRNRIVGVSVATGIGATIFLACLALGCVLLLDYLFELPLAVRISFLILVPLLALVLIGAKVLLPFARRYQTNDLAAFVEIAHPELRERLISTIELQEETERGNETSSPLMKSMLLNETVEFAKKIPFEETVDTRRAMRNCLAGGIAVLALVIPFVFATNAYAILLQRFVNPWGNYERPQNLILKIDNPDRTIGRGDATTFVVTPDWRFHVGTFPDSAWFEFVSSNGKRQARRMDWDEEKAQFTLTLPRVDEGFSYQVAADSSRTRLHSVVVVDRPEITEITADLTPPEYTGEPAQHLDAVPVEVLVLEQSLISWTMSFNKSIESAEFLWFDGETATGTQNSTDAEFVDGLAVRSRTPLKLSEDGHSASLQSLAALKGASGRFVIRTKDEHGLISRNEQIRRLTIIPDRPPIIEFADNEQHASARPDDVIHIPIHAVDDFGLSIVELHYEAVRGGVKNPGVISVPAEELIRKGLDTFITLRLGDLNVEHGMQVRLQGYASDHRPVPGPNETWTGDRVLQIRDDARAYGDQTLADQQHRVDQAMESLKTDLDKQRQAARQLQNQAQQEFAKNEAWTGDDKTKAMEDKIRELAQQTQKLSAVLEQSPVMEPLADKVQKLAEKELAQAAAKADEARKAPAAQKQQKLSEAADQLQKAEDEFKKLRAEHHDLAKMQRELLELNRLAENTEQLADKVDELSQRQTQIAQPEGTTKTPEHEKWEQDHKQLVERHTQLESDLGRVLQEHPDLLVRARENLQHQLASLGEQADRLANEQQALSQANRQAAQKKSEQLGLREKQNEVLQQEHELGQKLRLDWSEEIDVNATKPTREARESMEHGNLEESMKKHQFALEKLEKLAEALMQNQDLPNDPVAMAQEIKQRQQQLSEQAQNLNDEPTSENRETTTQMSAAQTALLRAAAELPSTDLTRDVRQQAIDRMKEAADHLAAQRLPQSRDSTRAANEAVQRLAEKFSSNSNDEQFKEQLTSQHVQDEMKREKEFSAEIQNQLQKTIEKQKELAEEIASTLPAHSDSQPTGDAAPSPQQSDSDAPATDAADASQPSESTTSQQMESQSATPSTQGNDSERGSMENSPADSESPSPAESMTDSEPESPALESLNLAELVTAQQQLADEARRLGDDARDVIVNNDLANQASHEFPNVARVTAHEIGQGNYQRAKETAAESIQKAQNLIEGFSKQDDGTIPQRLRTQAETLLKNQQDLARAIEQISGSESLQAQFREQRQAQLQKQTEGLSQQLGNRTEQLKLKQIDRASLGDDAAQGEEQAKLASQFQQDAMNTSQQGNSGTASEIAQKSVDRLREAAKFSRQASNGGNPHRAPDHVAQGEAGQQVAESAQHLNQAGSLLSQMQVLARGQGSETQPAGSDQDGESETAKSEDGDQMQESENGSQQGEGEGDGSQKNGTETEGDSSQAARRLRDAAKNMRQAAEQMGIANSGKRSNGKGSQDEGRESKESTAANASDTATNGEANLQELNEGMSRVSDRDWGKLPGTLKTELMESSQRPRDAAYSGLIRRYFEDLSKARRPEMQTPASR